MNLFQKFTVLVACMLTVCVFLVSIHAKDLVHYNDIAYVQTKAYGYGDITEKAVKELHDHVDKQVLKSFSKVFGDSTAIRGRIESIEADEEDPGILARIREHILIWRIYASLPFSAVLS